MTLDTQIIEKQGYVEVRRRYEARWLLERPSLSACLHNKSLQLTPEMRLWLERRPTAMIRLRAGDSAAQLNSMLGWRWWRRPCVATRTAALVTLFPNGQNGTHEGDCDQLKTVVQQKQPEGPLLEID